MPRFEVDTAQLGSGSASADGLTVRLGGLRGRAAAAGAGASCAGAPVASAAITQACTEFSRAIERWSATRRA